MELLDLGKQPISNDSPSGSDVKYEPEFESLQAEIDKMSIATTGGGGIDWNVVLNLSQTILAGKSKDLLVACYLGASLVATREAEGLSDGLKILKDLVDNFWDTLFPPKKRMRGRLNAVQWFLDRVESWLQSYDGGPLPPAAVAAVRDDFNAFDSSLSEKTDDAPAISRVLSYLDRLPVQDAPDAGPAPDDPAAPAPTPTAVPADQPASGPPPASTAAPRPAAAPAGPVRSAQDATQTLDSALDQMVAASDFMMQQDLANPIAYRATRLAAWMTLDRLPMSDGNQTPLPPPEAMIRSAIEGMISGRDYEGAIRAAEGRVREFLFWMDLSRFTAQALDEMGGKYQAASQAVTAETAYLVGRLPGIENLTFSDGTPFADKETRAWLRNITGAGPAAPTAGAGGGETEARVAEAFGQALALAKDKKMAEALETLQAGLVGSGSGRANMIWRLALIRLLLDEARSDLARPHLEVILERLETHQLEEWDPDMALDALKAVYLGLSEEEDDEAKAGARTVLGRISRIRPAEALAMLKG
ncbi:MAG: type VI secretion system protein TssA [Proteobacteria bacterium]|nr:type VI secretion system protein TssA [Pseudomonadota bacterium]